MYSSELVRKKATISDVETSFRDLAFIVSGDKNQEEIKMCTGEGAIVITN